MEGTPSLEAVSTRPAALPWTWRLVERGRLPPFAQGGLLALVWLAASFTALNALGCLDGLELGGEPFWRHPFVWFIPFYAPIGAYLAVVPSHTVGFGARRFRALGPALGLGPEEVARGEAEIRAVSPRALRIAGWIGLLLLVTFAAGFYLTLAADLKPEPWGRWLAVLVVQDAMLLWVGPRSWVVLLHVARAYARIAERSLRVDFFEPGPIPAFTALGLHLALLMMVGFALYAPLIPPAFTALSGALRLFAMAVPLVPVVAVAAWLMAAPMRGVRRAVVQAKAAELARVAREIGREREALYVSDEARKTAAAARLPGLLAWETRVQSVREWPFDAPALLRFALYVLIPLGSWLAAALVERALGLALD